MTLTAPAALALPAVNEASHAPSSPDEEQRGAVRSFLQTFNPNKEDYKIASSYLYAPNDDAEV